VLYVNAANYGKGLFQVSCPAGMNLLSCNYETLVGNGTRFDYYRGYKPISNQSCECNDYFGVTCAARCVDHPVAGFEIAVANGSGSLQAVCSAGKKVLGCHISPIFDTNYYDPWRIWYPTDDGSSCACFDDVLAECYATCATDIKDYEIVSAHGGLKNIFVSCKIPGNVVLGCGQIADDSDFYEKWTKAFISSQTTCKCYNYFGVTCYAICGKMY